MILSNLAQSLPHSGIREMMSRAGQVPGALRLEVGEPSFATPEHIVDAAMRAAREGATRYTAAAGVPTLREAVAERASARWGRPVPPAQVMVTAGAVNALSLAALTALDEGDEVLLPDPGWPNYVGMARVTRAAVRLYPMPVSNGLLPDPDDVAARVTPRTRALVINTPGNPTGVVWPPDVVRELVALANRHGLRLISDEIYEDFVYEGAHQSAAESDDQVVYVSGCSKSYAMTGWRLGFAVAPEPVVAAMERLQEAMVSCASSVSQAAAEAALRGPQDCVVAMGEAYARRRAMVVEALEPAGMLPVRPTGGFFALADLHAVGLRGSELAFAALEEAHVATVPGAGFGAAADTMLRLSFAASDEHVREGCARLRDFRDRRAGAHQNASATPSLRGSDAPA